MHPATPQVAARPARIHRTPLLWRAVVAAALTLPLALAGACASDKDSGGGSSGVDPIANGPVEISVFWWGGDKRADLTHQVLELYKSKHTNVTFKETWQANQGYIDKLNTQLAADAAADLFQLDDNMLGGVAERNAIFDLGPYVSANRLDFSKLQKSLVDYGKVNGKQVALPLAENTPGLVYNKTKLAALGVEEPQIGWTWEQFITWAQGVTTKSGGKLYGTMDPSADYKALWVWLRQQGKEFYSGKQLAFTQDDLTRWFDMWKAARDSRAAPPADIIHVANAGDVTKQLVVTGQAATSFVWSNQMPELAKNTKDELNVISYPGDPKGQWARAALYFAGWSKSKNKGTVVDIMNFFINDPEAGKILGTERGLPANSDIRSSVQSSVTDANMKKTVDFQNTISPQFGPAPPVPPNGQSAIRQLLIVTAEKVQFGQMSPSDAAKEFLEQAAMKLNV